MGKARILVIEDELDLREEVTELLTLEGYEVVSVENGELGVDQAIESRPDLILCDIMMPVMDGNQVLKKIRENQNTKLTPFIFMTALADKENVRSGMDLGADDYLTKPFTRNDLLQAIESRSKKHKDIADNQEEALNKLRKTIITRLPHELRSPLSGIIGFGTLLKDMSDSLSPQDVADLGSEILDSGNRLLRLIENYMVYVQLELSEPKIEITNGSVIDHIIKETAEGVAATYNRAKNLRISLSPTNFIHTSETYLQKIIYELLDNAFRFSPEDSDVSIMSIIDDRKYTLTISDHGRGFTKEQLNQIGAYMQFDRDKLEQQGSGLGLIIAKKMVEISGGEFYIESQRDKGSIFTLIFARS